MSHRGKRLILSFTAKLHKVITLLSINIKEDLFNFLFPKAYSYACTETISLSISGFTICCEIWGDLISLQRIPFQWWCFSLSMCVFSSITPDTSVIPHENFTADASGGSDELHTSSFQRKCVISWLETTNIQRCMYCFHARKIFNHWLIDWLIFKHV